MFSPKQITTQWLKQETDPGSVSRGQDYHRRNMATLEIVEHADQNTLVLIGKCRGSQRRPYLQQVEIVKYKQGFELYGQCTCPVSDNCKHAVALVLAWQAQYAEPKGDALDEWLEQLDHHQNSERDGKPGGDRAAGAQAVLYVLVPSTNPRLPIRVEFMVVQRKANGDWSKGRKTVPAILSNAWASSTYLRPVDEEIMQLLRSSAQAQMGSGFPITAASGGLALSKMIQTGRAFWSRQRLGPIRSGPERELQFQWRQEKKQAKLDMHIAGNARMISVEPPAWLDEQELSCGPLQLPSGMSTQLLDWWRNAPPVPNDRVDAFSRKLALRWPQLPTPAPVPITEHREPPQAVLTIDFDPRRPNQAAAQVQFKYADLRLLPETAEHGEAVIVYEKDQGLSRITRDLGQERALLDSLKKHKLSASDASSGRFELVVDQSEPSLRDAWFGWLETQIPELQADGWQIEYAKDWQISQLESIDGELEQDENGWFSLRFDLQFNGWSIPLVPLVSDLIARHTLDNLPEKLYLDVSEAGQDAHYVALPSEQIKPVIQTLIDLFDQVRGDRLELSRADAGMLSDLGPITLHGASSLQELARQLRDFSGLKSVKLPSTFKGTLRNYQQQGLNWLQFLREHQLNGILADDMGLGKTIQALAHLAVEKRAGRMRQPSLIVAPTSLMGNWKREAGQFTPGLKVLVLQGPDRAQGFSLIEDHDLVLTTYPLLARDRKQLLARDWHYLILDEAQQIKNPKSKAAQVARAFKSQHRLCLTGTPMENHLGELWAHFDFLMPGFLSDQKSFARNYRTPIEKHQEPEPLERLNRRIAPFLLRRTKDLVATELPPKTELLRTTSFEPAQARLYESIRLVMENKVAKAIAAKGLANSHIIVLDALLKLRQVCCDPRLLPKGLPGTRGVPSAKMNLLFDLLPDLLEEGRRVLLFSQFTTLLGLIEEELATRQIAYTKLTGQTRKREQAIERFRSGQVNLFLISLKAGGVGLNLVEADTVIHYDPWWNPAVEHQATDRAHRIGQDKPVFIYKLVTEGTVEEKIVALQASKHRLAQKVYGKGRKASDPPITEQTIAELLKAGPV